MTLALLLLNALSVMFDVTYEYVAVCLLSCVSFSHRKGNTEVLLSLSYSTINLTGLQLISFL